MDIIFEQQLVFDEILRSLLAVETQKHHRSTSGGRLDRTGLI